MSDEVVLITRRDVQKAITQALANQGIDRAVLRAMAQELLEKAIERAVANLMAQNHVERLILNEVARLIKENTIAGSSYYPAKFDDLVKHAVRDALQKQFRVIVERVDESSAPLS